ncbi:MAG: Rrf2 family transcriptional regulator [candidate division Zixibacteria bacterium]
MKFPTRARYGLRMMVELARLQQKTALVQLKNIAKVTGLSKKYLGQLIILLKDHGLVIGVSGRAGGYQLARPAREITLRQVIRAVYGPIFATECVANPDVCLNAVFCETRTIWSLISDKVQEILDQYTLADLVDRDWITRIKDEYPDSPYLHLQSLALENKDIYMFGCPSERSEL